MPRTVPLPARGARRFQLALQRTPAGRLACELSPSDRAAWCRLLVALTPPGWEPEAVEYFREVGARNREERLAHIRNCIRVLGPQAVAPFTRRALALIRLRRWWAVRRGRDPEDVPEAESVTVVAAPFSGQAETLRLRFCFFERLDPVAERIARVTYD